jgi:hypothetical protein
MCRSIPRHAVLLQKNKKHVAKKVSGYKSQDVRASRWDAKRTCELFVSFAVICHLVEIQDNKCFYCGQDMMWKTDKTPRTSPRVWRARMWSLDRINCSLGHLSSNCIAACLRCNVSRRDTSINTFARKAGLQSRICEKEAVRIAAQAGAATV